MPADIYYNKLGFLEDERHYDTSTPNSINYLFEQSGNKYYGTTLPGADHPDGVLADDMMSWYIHLPVIGNTICTIWDMFYT